MILFASCHNFAECAEWTRPDLTWPDPTLTWPDMTRPWHDPTSPCLTLTWPFLTLPDPDLTLGGRKFFVLNFWNIQSFRPLKRSPEPKNQVFPMFLTFVTSIFLIFGPFPGIAKIRVLTKQLLGHLTGSFFNLQNPWIPFYNRRIHTNLIIGDF